MRWLAGLGAIGGGVTALCCVTPVLPWLLAALGMGGAIGYVYTDAVLLPLLVGFLALTGFALWQMKRTR